MLDYFEFNYPFRITGLNSAFDYYWNNNFSFAGERHNFWELVCVLDGEVEVVENQNVYLLHSGNFICHAPMEFHRIRSSGDTQPHVLVLTFENEGVLPSKLKEGVFFLTPAETERYKTAFMSLHYNFYNRENEANINAIEAAWNISAFLIYLVQKHTPINYLSNSHSAEEYHKIIEIMEAAVRENVTLPIIASRNAISVSTVKNLFKIYAGMSPKAYYSRLRGNEALQLLADGKSIEEVSEMLNFSSPSYFSIFFKKQFGVPPGQYRSNLNKIS